METTFISIHDLSPDARVLYVSDSIVDVLGYAPEEVVNRPCWDFFHPEELPIAKAKHGKGVELDKAAILSYCRMLDKDGRWLGCEIVFTVVYDVLVSCTSIYRRGLKSQNRALEAPAVRRLFSSSPQDPRYHMLSHLSPKFTSPLKTGPHEPRAALFLNRYTRTLTIMYATNGLADVLGLSGEEMIGKSFYYCIEEACLPDAVRCLENAKLNDSIAYLKFWFRDPRQDDHLAQTDQWTGVDDPVSARRRREMSSASADSQALSSVDSMASVDTPMVDAHLEPQQAESRTSSGDSDAFTHENVFGESSRQQSSTSSVSNSGTDDERGDTSSPRLPIELEAVVSCTSDGLVVCLRRATSQTLGQPDRKTEDPQHKGVFVAPWIKDTALQAAHEQQQPAEHVDYTPVLAREPEVQRQSLTQPSTVMQREFMNSIREIAIFAWGVVGINGSLADYGRGQPRGESQPATGLPVWHQDALLKSPDPPGGVPQEAVDGHASTLGGASILEDHSKQYPRTSGFGFGDPGLSAGDTIAAAAKSGPSQAGSAEQSSIPRPPDG